MSDTGLPSRARVVLSRITLVNGAVIVRDRAAAWDAPWSCATCESVGPPTDPRDVAPLLAWSADHVACAAPTPKPKRSR
jgi:hypothetical protein